MATLALYFHRIAGAGGAERMVCMLANALCECGFAVHVVSWDDEGARSFYPLDQRVVWNRLGFRLGIQDKFRRSLALAKVLRCEGVGVLVGFVMSGDKTVYAAAKLARVSLVAAERNAPAMYRIRYSRLQRWQYFSLLHLTDCITVQFPDFAEGYPSTLRKRIVTTPNPVPKAAIQARPNRPDAEERFTLLAVSRLDGMQKT